MEGLQEATERMIKSIRNIWDKQTKETNGYFIRYIDGNKLNNKKNNLSYLHPKEAMENLDWCVDWKVGLKKKQIQFVTLNPELFIELYDDKCKRGLF